MFGRLILNIPDLISARAGGHGRGRRVQTVAVSPYWTSLAIRTASASSSKGMTATTGPKISSCATVWSLDPSEHGRRIEGAVAVGRLAAGDDLGALLAPGLDQAVHLVAVGLRDQRAHLRLCVERIADLIARPSRRSG